MFSLDSLQSNILHRKIFSLSFFLVVFVILISLMPFAFSSSIPTVETIDTKAQNVLDKIQKLLDGDESLYKISTDSQLQTVGLYADCTSKPVDTDCVFSVDSIRLQQTSESTGKVVAICVDNVDFDADFVFGNCIPLNVVTGELSRSNSASGGVGLELQLQIPDKPPKVGIEASLDVTHDWENSAIQRQPLTVPLPESIGLGFGDKTAGGNVLTDAGFGVLSTKFVVVKTKDIKGIIEFTGTVPFGIRLILGNLPDDSSEPVCNDNVGFTTCPTDFSDILKSINPLSTPAVTSVDHTPTTSETTFILVDFTQNQHNRFDPKITKIGLVIDTQTQSVIDTVNDLIAQGDLSQRTGRSILWLLNAAKTLEESGDMEGAILKLNSATQRVNLFAQRNILPQNTAQSILDSIQNTINNIENPPDNGGSPILGSKSAEDIVHLKALSGPVADEIIDIDEVIDSFNKFEEVGLFLKLLDVTVDSLKMIPDLIVSFGGNIADGADVSAAIGDIKMGIDDTEDFVDNALMSLDTVTMDVENAFMFSTSCPEGTSTIGVGPAALCTTEPSCPTGTAPNVAGTECVIRTGGIFPACPSGSVDNLVGECGPEPQPSTCPSGFIKKSEITCGVVQNPSCPTGTAPNVAGTECVIRTGGIFPACPSGSVDNLAGECGPVTTTTCPGDFKIIGGLCGEDTIPAVEPRCPSGTWNGLVCVGGDPCNSGFDWDFITGKCEKFGSASQNPSCGTGLSPKSSQKCEGPRIGGSAAKCPSGTSFNAFSDCVLKTPCPSGSVDNGFGECGPVNTKTCPSGFIKKSEITCGVTQNPGCPSGTAANLAGTECVIRTGGIFPACPSGSVDNLAGECGPTSNPSTCPSGFIKKSEITCGVVQNPSCPTDFDNVLGTCTKPAI